MAHQHSPHHDHSKPHCHETELGRKNEEHFDNVAEDIFEVPWVKACDEQTSAELIDNFQWINAQGHINQESKLLDYACGNGIVSRALAPFFSTIRGMDISSKMVTQYNLMAAKSPTTKDKMSAIHFNLLNPSSSSSVLNSPEYQNFNLIVMSMALHHVQSPELMLQKLLERLAPGGVLLIIDIADKGAEGFAEHSPAKHTIAHHGFEEEELMNLFDKVGLEQTGWKLFEKVTDVPEDRGGHMQLFMARGCRIC